MTDLNMASSEPGLGTKQGASQQQKNMTARVRVAKGYNVGESTMWVAEAKLL